VGGFPIYVHVENIGGFQTKEYTFADDKAVLASEKMI
jgi:hypothetical protein